MAAIRQRIDFPEFDLPGVKLIPWTLGVILGLATWYAIAIIFPMGLLPNPHETAIASYELIRSGNVWPHLWATLFRTFWGFAGAAILGIAAGVFMGINDFGEDFVTPYIMIAVSIPGIAWAAITTLIVGFGTLAPILATVVTVFPYMALNVWKGVENIDTDLIAMSRSFTTSRPRLLVHMIIPSVAPAVFTALRFGLAISWKVETAAELFASNTGMGIRAIEAFRFYDFQGAMAWSIIFVVFIVLVEVLILRPLERKVFEYRPEADFDVLN